MGRGEMRNTIFSPGTAILLLSMAVSAPAWAQRAKRGRRGLPTPAEMSGKTAGEVFKNIKVLNNVPADQVLDGMRYITIALGVRCSFCHNIHNFPSDQKRTKRIARKMMSMLFAINKDNFRGRPVVGCYTCHQGHQRPLFAPLPSEEIARPAAGPVPSMTLLEAKKIKLSPGTSLPTVDQVLAKYAQALGGKAALASVRTREITVERTGRGQNRPPVRIQVYEKTPNRFLILAHVENHTYRVGYTGKQGWVSTPRGPRPLDAMDALVPLRDAMINPAAALAGYQMQPLKAMAQIGNRKAYVVSGRAPDGQDERLYFDTESRLLLRRVFIYHTIFGPLLFQANYGDYRKEGNVELPFRIEWWTGNSGYTETVQSVKQNLPVPNAEFQPPKPPATAGAGRR